MKPLKRRQFIKVLSASAAYLGATGIDGAFAKKELIPLTILYSNDIHSYIDKFPANDPKYPGLGGAERKVAAIKKVRNEQKNVLLFDAGDMLQGSAYYNLYKGELEFKLMSEMGYDAVTIGNHEFDNGLEQLAAQMVNANFPFICSNYNFKNTPLDGKTISNKVFEKGGIKVGVFGLGIELDGLVNEKMYGNTVYSDPEQEAASVSHYLKHEKKCDLVVCLSHLGYRYDSLKISDHILAKKSKNIDLIIGGHTHTFLDEPPRYKNSEGKEVLICQAGCYGVRIGRIDYLFEKKIGQNLADAYTIKNMNNASAK